MFAGFLLPRKKNSVPSGRGFRPPKPIRDRRRAWDERAPHFDGFCYLRGFDPRRWDFIGTMLDRYPSVKRVLECEDKSLCKGKLRPESVGPGWIVWHFEATHNGLDFWYLIADLPVTDYIGGRGRSLSFPVRAPDAEPAERFAHVRSHSDVTHKKMSHPLELVPSMLAAAERRDIEPTEAHLHKLVTASGPCAHAGLRAQFMFPGLCWCSEGDEPLGDWLFGDQEATSDTDTEVASTPSVETLREENGIRTIVPDFGDFTPYVPEVKYDFTPGTCWEKLFPDVEYGLPGLPSMLVAELLKELKNLPSPAVTRDTFTFMTICETPEGSQEEFHVSEPSLEWYEGCMHVREVIEWLNAKIADDFTVRFQSVGLTTAVVLGTIGDIEPTLDVVAANYFAAQTQAVESDDLDGKFRFTEQGHGWCASDFLELSPRFARALDDKVGAAKGQLEVLTSLWNEICGAWGGVTIPLDDHEGVSHPGGFPMEQEDVWNIVPDRPIGNHERVFPEDFVLVTHPDHIEKLKNTNPQAMAKIETRAVSMPSHDFIKLGQDILQWNFKSLGLVKEMQHTLIGALKVTLPIVEQSDLVYLVSGTTYHYFIGSLFPDKQVYEVCPVPREDNGTCPEFYLGHYAQLFSMNPHFGHEMGRLHNKWLMAPKCLAELEWEGEFKYTEPPKFHSIAPWAQDKWKIQSANIGFKPYDDIVRKTSFVETHQIKAYVSFGSCEDLTKDTRDILVWLRSLNVEWHCDPRWAKCFEGCNVVKPGFFSHTTGLHQFDWVVHHGGSGTTNTCLAVGVPQTIIPQIGDQFIWRDALRKHCIQPYVSEGELRGHLYHTRLPPSPSGAHLDVSPAFRRTIEEVGGRYIKPFFLSLPCCHDWNEYGLKLLDKVIAETDDIWITLFDSGLQRTGTPSGFELKWINKECKITGPALPGWRGTNVNATYPFHAHGWLGDGRPREGIDCQKEIPEEWLTWLARQSLSAKDKRLKRVSQRPSTGECKLCHRTRELLFNHCSRCVGDIVANAVETGEIPDLPPLTRWEGGGAKAPDKSVTVGPLLKGQAIRSMRRYYQLDSRMLSRAPNYMVARAIMDRVRDWSDTKWVEAFWSYTNSWPPHYKKTTNTEASIAEIAAMHANVELGGLASDVVAALGKVLSVSSGRSIARRMIGLNILTPIGRGLMRDKWHVMVDALRHYSEFAESLDIKAMPEIVKNYFDPIPSADCTSLVHFKRGVASPIRARAHSHRWMETVRTSGSPLLVHFFSLKLPALGPLFGVFHAVVEYKGMFYELQQVAGEQCFINETKWQPEATPSRSLVKTIVVSENVVGDLPIRLINREFNGKDYKVLGDNCLVFANLLVYCLTRKVIPWRHFGAFGQELTFEMGTLLRKWAVSHLWLDEQEKRVSISTMKFSVPSLFNIPVLNQSRPKAFTGPSKKIKDYGLHALRQIEAAIRAYDDSGPEDTPWSSDMLMELALLGYKRFGLSSHLISRALMKMRMNNMPQRRRKVNLFIALRATLRKLESTRLAGDVKDLLDVTSKLRMPLRAGKKPAWAPLVNITVPRHWFMDRQKLVEVRHDPENLTVGNTKVVKLDLPQIFRRYTHYFPDVEFPQPGFKFVRPGEYEIGVKVPIRKNLPRMDELTWSLVTDLQEMHPFELGVFSLRFGTEEMAEKVTNRYFTGTFEAGQLIPEVDQQELADAIFRNEEHLYKDAQLINPEEVWRKWHKNYSAGFPFRFNARGNAKRQQLIDAAGGKTKFLQAIRDYIASPESFPTVSHAFIKDEVLPKSYIEREKIRTIIAQDPLNYYAQMAIHGDHGKRLDPASFSAVGVSPAHGELAALAEKHLAYTHHYAMDITALDSTAAVDAVDTIKRLRKRGFENHPQRENINTMVDATLDNLVSSWIIDIHTGRSRLKKQGLSTGHGNTTAINTEYVKILMLYAWRGITGRSYDEFYQSVKFSSFSDDNFWSTNLSKDVFSAQLISDFWLRRGVQVRVEGESDDLSQLSFLAKRFSFDPEHLAEVRKYAQRDASVAIVHDVERLLQKFSDYKKKNTLAYRWEKLVALQANCAHHKDIYDKVSEYLDALERDMTRRQFMRKFMKQHPRKSYGDIMEMMYSPKNNKSGLIVSSIEDSLSHKILMWWDTLRVDIMTFDSTVGTYARILQQFTGLLEIGGLNTEDPGVYLQQPGTLPEDPELTLEHHVYLLNGCPGTFEQYRMLVQKTPFAAFCNAEKFWSTRERFDISEEVANGLRAKVLFLQGLYTVIAWLERFLTTLPVVGPMYKVFCAAKGMSEQVYSRLNALYYAMFGDSSLILSSMMPKDRYQSLKVLAFKMWVQTTSTDLLDFAGDLDQFQALADAAAKLAQDLNNLFFEFDISSVVPRPDTGESRNTGVESGWVALDHSASVQHCRDLLGESEVPLVTGPTGCGKSTDFIMSLYETYNTVLVACPRRILVQQNPIAQKRLYAGSDDKLTPGLINFGTAGYYRQVLSELPDDSILVLDEFHELDEDTLWLHRQFRDNVICVSATPDFVGSQSFSPVALTKSRNSGHVVETLVLDTKAEISDVWDELTGDGKMDRFNKTLCIVPTVRMVHELTRHAVKLASSKRVCELFRGHDTVVEADWYFATSIVDAGLTIPDLDRVIDAGWSSGWSSGQFTTRPSSHNVMDQRKGRTGRMNDGTYVRLQNAFNDTPFDFSTPFIYNHWDVVKEWSTGLTRPTVHTKGVLDSLPPGYERLFRNRDWSCLIYLVFFYANRGDIDRTRADYQSARKFPNRPDVQYIVGPRQNHNFSDLHRVESSLSAFRFATVYGYVGNVWTWDGSTAYVETFKQPVPAHLRDRD